MNKEFLLTLQNEIAELEQLLIAKKQLLEEVKNSIPNETVLLAITQNINNHSTQESTLAKVLIYQALIPYFWFFLFHGGVC